MAQPEDIAASDSKNWIGRNRRMLLIGGPAILIVAVVYFYLTGGQYASTDDAYIRAARVDISSNVSGRVEEIAVHDR